MTNPLVAMLMLALAGVSAFGAWQKLRDGSAVYRQRWLWSVREWDAERDSDPAGFWLSVGINILFAGGLSAGAAFLLMQTS